MPEFPRQPLDRPLPTGGLRDELLADPPEDAPPTPLKAYGHGKLLRRSIYLALGVGVIAAIFIGRWYMNEQRERSRTPAPSYEVTEGGERPKVFHWSQGRARLGLHRGEAGIEAIVLPDRVLRLPKDVDDAQVVVDVRDGRSEVRIVSGRIIDQKVPASEQRDPQATAP